MNFQLTKEQESIRQMVKEFVQNNIKPIAAESDATGIFPMNSFKKMADLGLLSLPFPKEYGGAGGDYFFLCYSC